MPSAASKLTGIKPTWGRVSRHGLIPGAETLDHVGPLARSAADAAAIHQAIAGPDPADPTALADPVPDYLAGMHAGVDREFTMRGLSADIIASLANAVAIFERLDMHIREITSPWNDEEMIPGRTQMDAEMALIRAGVAFQQATGFHAGNPDLDSL